MKGLTDIPGILVGHVSDFEALTGCTAILCEGGAVAGCEIRGGASGTQEFDVMNPLHITPSVHAVVFSGGSAFGLEAACGVRRYLEQKGIGFQTGAAMVPIVPCAILYDLNVGKANVRPTREMGEAAAAAATAGPVQEGAVGAGTGATVGKVFGLSRAMKSGLGSFTVELSDGVLVSALAAVNAVGDVVDPQTNKIVAGARQSASSREFSSSADELRRRGSNLKVGAQNTTLVAVATNARLSKLHAMRVAQLAQTGLAQTVRPAFTATDGDLVIALSLGEKAASVDAVGLGAAEATSQAILRAVRLAKSLGGLPGLAG